MGKKIIICFDGTANDPKDAEQKIEESGQIKDDSITNILKLHLMFGGGIGATANEQAFANGGQISLYHPGVGTYGGFLKRVFNTLLAPQNADVGRIITDAREDLAKVYEKDNEIFLFGFSRGAAIARRFAAVIGDGTQPELRGVKIRFMGLFDTVASIGFPNLDRDDRPRSDVVFENNSIAPSVNEALHLLALNEKRLAFRPTLIRKDPRVTEVWFPGAHADVGGGYYKDGLSDVALSLHAERVAPPGAGPEDPHRRGCHP
ncbi:MAG: DUF2235 domain-containing protein [Magnetococcales bacterium]|nr:DUF2235 domain-containing protein [Magnetococcales bacterium]